MKISSMNPVVPKISVVCLLVCAMVMQGQTAAPAANTSAPAGKSAAAQVISIPTELVGWLESKKAKAGDAVVLKTTQDVYTNTGVEIKKGTKLVGKIVAAQPYKKGQTVAQITLQFDYADLGGGQKLALLTRITGLALSDQAAGDQSQDTSLGGNGSARSQGGAGASGDRGSVLSVGNTSASIGSLTAMPGTFGGGSGVATSSGTGIPGLMLTINTGGTAAGTLSAKDKNIDLDSGTHIVLAVMLK